MGTQAIIVHGQPLATGQGDGKETTASDKAQRPGGVYLVRGVYVDAHGEKIEDAELEELGLSSSKDKLRQADGAGTAGTKPNANAENDPNQPTVQ